MSKKVAAIVALLMIASLSVTACVSSNDNQAPSTTPQASTNVQASITSKATSPTKEPPLANIEKGQDPLLLRMLEAYNKSNPKGAQFIYWGDPLPEMGLLSFVGFGNDIDSAFGINHFNTAENATKDYTAFVANQTKSHPQTEVGVAWGLSYYEAAAGHAPAIKRVQTNYVGGGFQQHQTYIQYDNITIFYAKGDNP